MPRSDTPSSVRPASDWRTFLTIPEFARAARAALPPVAWDYFRAGADAARTVGKNVRAFARYELWPKVLVDVTTCAPAVTLFGERLSTPILVAPMAYQKLAHPDGELATARAAATAATIFIASTLSTVTLEEIAAATAAPKWFQLYIHKDRGVTSELVARARAAGYRALVLTVDTPVLGRRLCDVRNGFALRPGLTMANLGTALSMHDVAARHDASVGWRDVEWLQEAAGMPVLLKGILRADDAAQVASAGVAGIIVSNHGGRQLDGAPATLDALPGVVAAVAGRCPVLLDGGIRWGTDVLTALGLGAAAVCVGRPVLFGLACGGEAGAARILAILTEELVRAMALAGCPDVASIPRDLVRPGWV